MPGQENGGQPLAIPGTNIRRTADQDQVSVQVGESIAAVPTVQRIYLMPSLASSSQGGTIRFTNRGADAMRIVPVEQDGMDDIPSASYTLLPGDSVDLVAQSAIGATPASWFSFSP